MPAEHAVRILNAKEVASQLAELHALLLGLPETVPKGNQHYLFEAYSTLDEEVQDFGEEGALNHSLQVIFCPGGRSAGPVQFKEQGRGLVAVVDVLRTYIEKFPASVVIQKWIFDLIEAAKSIGAVCPLFS